MADKSEIEVQVEGIFANQELVNTRLQELLGPEKFQQFIEFQKEITDGIADTWKQIETAMIDNGVKSIKGDWGSIGITERTSYKVVEAELPDEYFKRAPDLKKIGAAYTLMGEAPAGVTPNTTKFLTKRINK